MAQWVIERLSALAGGEGVSLLIVLVIALAGANLLQQVTLLAVRWLSYRISLKGYYTLQNSLYRTVLYQPISFFHRKRVGDLISRIENDVAATTQPISEVIQSFTSRFITLIVLAFVMFQTSSLATLIVLGIGGAATLLPMVMGRHYRRYMRRQQTRQADVIAGFQETLSSARLIKSAATEERELEAYWRRAMRTFAIQLRIRLYLLIALHSGHVTSILALAALLAAGSYIIRSGSVSVAEFATFVFIAREAGVLLAELGKNILLIYEVLGASERVVELLRTPPELVDGNDDKHEFLDTIELQDVSFDYGNGQVLDGVNLTIRRGEFIALVGPSGGGKSTVLDLILRLQDPDSGKVMMDGVDVRSFSQKSYRRLFGVVSQETILFNDTVHNNLAYSAAEVDHEQVVPMATAANAHKFIESLPKKYHTLIGDRGVRLSGGERQRLAIARALMSKPQVLLFDEATSSLDNMAERQVQQSIDRLVRTNTAVVVAHRLSTIERADHIYVVDQGRIVESGTHQQLKARGGLYQSLLQTQSGVTLAAGS